MEILKKLDKALIKIQEYCVILCVIAMVLLICWQVLCRYVLIIPTSYAEELCRLAIVWCIFVGSSLAMRNNDHMGVDALLTRLPRTIRLVFHIIIYALIVVLAYVMVRYGIRHTIALLPDLGTSLRFSKSVFYLPEPLAGALIGVYAILNCVIDIHKFIKEKPETKKAEQEGGGA